MRSIVEIEKIYINHCTIVFSLYSKPILIWKVGGREKPIYLNEINHEKTIF